MTTIDEREPLTIEQRVERMEALGVRLAAALGIDQAPTRNDVPAEYVLSDGSVSHMHEQARWVVKGDWIQALHGDTDWAEVLHAPVHSEGMTGLVTRRADGSERIRWWAHTELVRVAETPVRVVAGQERRWDR